MNKINIGTEIDLDDLLVSRMLIQANSGGGKSGLARKIMEQSYGIVPFIVIDYDGEYYTLKEKLSDVVVIGGHAADIPISLQAAALLPREIVSNRLSVVIDPSEMKMNGRIEYVKRFLESLMELPKTLWTKYLIFIEEAHKYCGEQEKQESGPAVRDLMSRGRKMGYCGILITQRISKLHKDAAAEANNKFVGRTNLDIDMDRAARELGFTSSSEYTRLSLRDLKPRHFFCYGTSIQPHHVHEVTIGLCETTIPKEGQIVDFKPKKPTAQLLQTLNKLNDLPKEAAKEALDKKELQAEISRLKVELGKKPLASQPIPDNNKQVQQARDEMRRHYTAVIKDRDAIILAAHGQVRKLQAILAKICQLSGAKPISIQPIPIAAPPPVSKIDTVKASRTSLTAASEKPAGNVQAGPLRYLKAAAMFYPNPISKKRMCAMAGTSFRSSTHRAYMASLKRDGLLEVINSDSFKATEKGISMAGELEQLPAPGQEMIDMWCSKLGNGPAIYLRKLAERYPRYIRKEDLAASAGTEYTKSTHRAYMAELNACQLIETTSDGVKASDELFESM